MICEMRIGRNTNTIKVGILYIVVNPFLPVVLRVPTQRFHQYAANEIMIIGQFTV